MPTDVDNLDPRRSFSGAQYIFPFLYDQLIWQDAAGELQPWLAEEWESNADSTTFTFTIREGATCSDGTEVTASTIAAWFQATADGDNVSKTQLFGPEGFNQVVADDASRTVEVTLNNPYSELIPNLAGIRGAVICPAALDNPDILTNGAAGSGPFTLEEVERGVSYRLTVRDDYTWGPNGGTTAVAGLPASVDLQFVSEESTATNLFATGDLDVVWVAGRDRERLLAIEGAQAIENPTNDAELMVFNETDGRPTTDLAVRRALVQAVDAAEYAAVQTGGRDVVLTTSLVSPENECLHPQESEDLLAFDLDAARAELGDAGFTETSDGSWTRDGQPLTITILATSTRSAAAELLQLSIQDLGIQADVRIVSPTEEIDAIMEGDFDFIPMNLSWLVPRNAALAQFVNWSSPETDEIVDAILSESDRSTRCELYQEYQLAGISRADFSPLFLYSTSWITRDVEFDTNLDGGINPLTLRIDG